MPNLYIIAGPDGAGKTTASYTLFSEILNVWEFINADEIARGLSPFQSDSVAFEAGRIMLQRIDFLLDKGGDFALETTLLIRSYVQTIRRAKEAGIPSRFSSYIYLRQKWRLAEWLSVCRWVDTIFLRTLFIVDMSEH